ncbi:N-acetylmuramoyl-L-alanine amidase [Candidatus Poribacteria bacterium]|nr:N-acetylmuramoyl-L-alanine amidase [Candidatus Poribacteria bacterium]
MRSRFHHAALFLAVPLAGAIALIGACRARPVQVAAGSRSWQALPALPEQLPPQAVLLRGLTIVLDPGHGGDVGPEFERIGYKRGPTGLREAIINLRTAGKLQQLLEQSGARVVLTRADDSDVPLPARVELANASRADIFLSIHHNSGSPSANYPSVWYHGEGEEFPASLDIAREISESLVFWLRHDQPLSEGIYSDTLMYDDGFAVLRGLNMPGVLAECSFFSNPAEESRLKLPEYNDRVAWALYLGLCRWAANGVPRWEVIGFPEPGKLTIRLDDGMKQPWGSEQLRIRRSTLVVTLNGEPVADTAWNGGLMTVRDGKLKDNAGPVILDVRFENRNKNSSITPPSLIDQVLAGLSPAPPSP